MTTITKRERRLYSALVTAAIVDTKDSAGVAKDAAEALARLALDDAQQRGSADLGESLRLAAWRCEAGARRSQARRDHRRFLADWASRMLSLEYSPRPPRRADQIVGVDVYDWPPLNPAQG